MEQTCKPAHRYWAEYFNKGNYAKKSTMPTDDLDAVVKTAQTLSAQGKRVWIRDSKTGDSVEIQ